MIIITESHNKNKNQSILDFFLFKRQNNFHKIDQLRSVTHYYYAVTHRYFFDVFRVETGNLYKPSI